MELLDFSYLFMESGLFAGCPGTYEEYRQGLDTDRLQVRLKEFLQRETASLRLTEEYAQAVSLPKIRHFLEQELAYRMWRAFEQGLLYREQPFVLGIDAKRLDQDLPEGEKVLIQGYHRCLLYRKRRDRPVGLQDRCDRFPASPLEPLQRPDPIL